MITAYAWRNTETGIEAKVRPFTDEAAALVWLRNAKMPFKDMAQTKEENALIRKRLGIEVI